MRRVVLGGGTLHEFEPSTATDAYIKARFVPAGAPYSPPFSDDDLSSLVPAFRPRPRRVTVRRWNEEARELTLDFVIHGDVGFAGSWARRCVPGDRLQFTGPGGSYRPNPAMDWHLFVGDETALPAIASSLETLDDNATGLVFAVVDGADHELPLPDPANVTVRWLYRYGSNQPEDLLLDAVAATQFPEGTYDAFVHGEAAEVRAVRKHLIADRGVNPDTASISPYWRRTLTDEQWRQVKKEWIADQASDV